MRLDIRPSHTPRFRPSTVPLNELLTAAQRCVKTATIPAEWDRLVFQTRKGNGMSSVATPIRRVDRALETIALTEDSWRVCDASLPDDDGRRLLAYVEQIGDRVETLWMWPRAGECSTFESFDHALVAIHDRLTRQRALPEAS